MSPNWVPQVAPELCSRCGARAGVPPLGLSNPIFVQFLTEVRDKAIARGEIGLARDIDMYIPAEKGMKPDAP